MVDRLQDCVILPQTSSTSIVAVSSKCPILPHSSFHAASDYVYFPLPVPPTLYSKPLVLRVTGQMNINSSRSHCIVQFTISSTTTKNIRETLSGAGKPGTPDFTRLPHKSDREPDPGSEASTSDLETAITTRATLSLVDLAGSERGGIDSEDMGAEELERKRINASLSALSNCIFRLGESGRTHVPYRDSSLTRSVSLAPLTVYDILSNTIQAFSRGGYTENGESS